MSRAAGFLAVTMALVGLVSVSIQWPPNGPLPESAWRSGMLWLTASIALSLIAMTRHKDGAP